MGWELAPPVPRIGRLIGAAVLAVPLTLPVLLPAAANAGTSAGPATATSRPAFTATNLVSDQAGPAALVDPDLVNPIGLAASATSPLWVSNAGTDTSTLYGAATAAGVPATKAALIVAVAGAPTGQVFNGGAQLVVTGPTGVAGPARFIFSTRTGQIAGWNPAAAPTTAIVAASTPGAVYTGLALLPGTSGPALLATDFRRNRVDEFDATYQRVALPAGAFTDRRLPRGFSAFDVAVLGNSVYVTYALRVRNTEVRRRGLGIVDQFDTTGRLVRRVGTGGVLSAPWGLALAPASFGPLAGDLLVGNTATGTVAAFDTATGRFRGLLRGANGRPLVIGGLWGLLPATASAGGADAVWFSAGPGRGQHGLIGVIRPAAAG
jgi:uncharacterized protein (TIGR03118 family)